MKNWWHFIDRQTENGAIFPTKPWGEGIGIEEDCWIECLVDLLDEIDTPETQQILLEIAFTGTDENFVDAMECIRNFRAKISQEIWQNLDTLLTNVLRKRI